MAPPPSSLSAISVEPVSPHAVALFYNQPKIANAFTLQQYYDLRTVMLWAREEEQIKVVVIAGRGRHFCAGKVLQSPSDGGPTIEQEIQAGGALGEVLQSFPKVVIAAVYGAAVGWGCTQLASMDLVYAHPSATFQTPFTRLGFVPEGQSSHTFPRIMGKFHANRFLLTSEKLTAHEAYVSGLVTQVLGSGEDTVEQFQQRVKDLAARIGDFDGESLRMTKALVNRPSVLAEQREAGMREGADLRVRLNDPKTLERIAAFAKKEDDAKKEPDKELAAGAGYMRPKM